VVGIDPTQEDAMRYRTIGDGDRAFEVSTLCLGTMWYGTHTDETTARALLDRFVEAGGTFLDTSNNYNGWDGGYGRDSEDVIGRWLADRRNRDEIRIATKVGAAKKDPDLPQRHDPPSNYQWLGAETIAAEARESLRHLGVERLDAYYGHVDDVGTPLAETVGAFGKLQAEGLVGVTGISNAALHRVVEAREEARRQGVAPYALVQQQLTYPYPRPDVGRHNWASYELLDYARASTEAGSPLAVVAYSPLMGGALVRDDKPLWAGFDHPTTHERLRVLREVAGELGATPNQVLLAWLTGGAVPVIPIVGPSSVAQLDELLGAADLDLDPALRARLDAV
jgi:aryl-alcohol dehydrogenase-like predicted oxidoreductase